MAREITITGLADLLDDAAKRTQNLAPVLDKAADRHMARVNSHFENESSMGSELGNDWPGLSPRYAKRRKSTGKLLQVSGALKASVEHEAIGNRLTIGSNVVYSRAHDSGNPDGNLPMRKYLAWHPKDLQETARDCFHYILTGELPSSGGGMPLA